MKTKITPKGKATKATYTPKRISARAISLIAQVQAKWAKKGLKISEGVALDMILFGARATDEEIVMRAEPDKIISRE